jgi:hypothetical protein
MARGAVYGATVDFGLRQTVGSPNPTLPLSSRRFFTGE